MSRYTTHNQTASYRQAINIVKWVSNLPLYPFCFLPKVLPLHWPNFKITNASLVYLQHCTKCTLPRRAVFPTRTKLYLSALQCPLFSYTLLLSYPVLYSTFFVALPLTFLSTLLPILITKNQNNLSKT